MRTKLLLFIFLFSTKLLSQSDQYFQQEVNYKIAVTLNDREHQLNGDLEIIYKNNAPQPLDSIYFHLWANAFKENGTAYDEQKLRLGSTRFYFSQEKERGYYSGLNFTVDGQDAELVFATKNPDIAVLLLPESLAPGASITIKTPFTLKIPASFSRLGHVKTSYQMTQWYPKPAVFDAQGWHPMPYLDLGEFYSEFGSFDVRITLPENYVVGATGVLQTEQEKDFLQQKIAETKILVKNGFPEKDTFPASSSKYKTIRYTAENVHDFAWFADKRFHVLKEEAILKSGKKIDTWAFFTNAESDLWVRGAEYVSRAVEFYSEHLGEYPWPQATAVHSALSAGGGMEYPMITVIGNSGNARALDDVITHEVGHNWFYGILASNERDHAWMDEGMNSYYEYRYMRKYYGDRIDFDLPGFVTNGSPIDIYELIYLYNARRNLDQAPATHSNHFTNSNYMIGAYVKPGSVMGHLEQYLGTNTFAAIMQAYYEKWKFRHPGPEDFRKIVEEISGKDLGWFFSGYIGSNKKLDYALGKTTKGNSGYVIEIKNKGELNAPFPVSGLKNGEIINTVWFEGFTEEKEINFPPGDYDAFLLDAGHVTLDLNRRNNSSQKLEPVKIGFLAPLENPRKFAINLFPALGANEYDGLMLGLGIHNGLLPARKFEFQNVALYGFNSRDVVGLGSIKFNVFPKSEKIRRITFGLSSKAFNYAAPDSLRTETGFSSTHLQYQRIVPSIRIDLQRSFTSKFYQTIQLRSIFGNEQLTDFQMADSGEFYYVGNRWEEKVINELSWEIGNKRVLNPYRLRLVLEQQTFNDVFEPEINRNYVRANLEWKSAYTYAYKRRFDFRLFIGGFLKNDYSERGIVANASGAYNLTGQGFNDYRWDELYLGRTETSGLLARQVTEREGGMKIALGSPYQEGRSNKFIIAANLMADLPQDLPGKIPLRPYFDIAYYKDNRPISTNDPEFETSKQLWFQGGFSLEFLDGLFAVHIPVVHSSHVKDLLDQSGQDGFFERITFTLDLHKWNPWDIVDKIDF